MPHKKMLPAIAGIFFLPVLLISLSFNRVNKKDFETIAVEGGAISGTKNATGDIRIFKGIPFAAPPIGNLRWKEPQPVVPWSGIKKCDAFSASPMQSSPEPFGPWSVEYLIPKEPISEDCLYLNVWTGAASQKEKRPVIVWIYGGGFVSGGSGVPVYDGEAMAKKGIVFVSINYRVGIFGFFAHPDLTKESGHNASGNYGLMDQVAALGWVKKNIAAFGGDPGNVTIAGQSAGSMSVNCLVASPLCKSLFKHAIAESGAIFISGNLFKTATLKQTEEEGVKFAESFKAGSVAELRKISSDELLKKQWGMRGPIIDGYVMPQSIAAIFAAGKQNEVGLLTGWNEDDGVVFGKMKSVDEFKNQAQQQYGADAEKFLQLYPAHTDEEAQASQGKLSRDLIFGIQNYTWANVQSGKSKYKAYLYRFARRLPATGDYVKFGAFHTGEVAYAYNNLSFVYRCPWEPVDHELASTISSYWANFAATGDPNSKGLPVWPAYNTKDYATMIFGEKIESKSLPGKSGLDFLIEKMK